MPTIEVNGTHLHYLETGSGAETIVFSHGFLMNRKMFDAQIAALKDRYRIVAFDHRGHGDSAPCPAPFDLYDLVDDAEAVIRALADGPVHFAGMSTGGFVGMRLALRAPGLIRSLTLIDTAGDAEDPAALKQYDLLLFVARWFGLRPVMGRALPILMGATFLADPARADEVRLWRARILELDRRSVHRFGKAIFHRDDVLAQLAAHGALPPVQIIVGEQDVATPPARSEALQAAMAGARLARIPRAGHTSPVEAPDAVTAVMEDFLREIAS